MQIYDRITELLAKVESSFPLDIHEGTTGPGPVPGRSELTGELLSELKTLWLHLRDAAHCVLDDKVFTNSELRSTNSDSTDAGLCSVTVGPSPAVLPPGQRLEFELDLIKGCADQGGVRPAILQLGLTYLGPDPQRALLGLHTTAPRVLADVVDAARFHIESLLDSRILNRHRRSANSKRLGLYLTQHDLNDYDLHFNYRHSTGMSGQEFMVVFITMTALYDSTLSHLIEPSAGVEKLRGYYNKCTSTPT